jgi:16S rRNA (cytosine967-C5)-methyltransferase
MTPAARVSAAIEVLSDIEARRRPAADALKDWGLGHRFAGSGDRSAIANLVYDALRVRASSAFVMQAETPRAIMLGALLRLRGLSLDSIMALCSGDRFAPEPLTAAEGAAIIRNSLDGAPDCVRGDFPDWLTDAFQAVFGENAVPEAQALATRAPLDLRVNSLKSLRPKVSEALSHLGAMSTPFSTLGLRIMPQLEGKPPSLQGEPSYLKGQIEIQDEGSQIVAQLTGATAGEQALDLCAGGGGKTLAIAAMMNNKGQIYATDSDARRLAPIHERLERAGVRNVQVRTPRGKAMPLDDLEGRMDLVVIDAPCTGAGTWRRNPDAKWRIRPGALAERQREQADILDNAPRYVKPGGRIVYITCSVLRDENDARIEAFLARHPRCAVIDAKDNAAARGFEPLAAHATTHGLLLTPLRTGTDGFYVSILSCGAALRS